MTVRRGASPADAEVFVGYRPEFNYLASAGKALHSAQPPGQDAGEKDRYSQAITALQSRMLADPDRFTENHSIVARVALEHKLCTSARASMIHAGSLLQSFDRIQDNLDSARGWIAAIGEKTVGLYLSQGRKDLIRIAARRNDPFRTIALSIENGRTLDVAEPVEPTFPSALPLPVPLDHVLIDGRPKKMDPPWDGFSKFDPESKRYQLPFTVLGEGERPAVDLNRLLDTDARRFAMRLLAYHMNLHEWLKITAPGEQVRTKVAEEFAWVYGDRLLGLSPSDQTKPLDAISIQHTRRNRDRGIDYRPKRKVSLWDYSRKQREGTFYAAGITASDVEAATREQMDVRLAKELQRQALYDKISVANARAKMERRMNGFFTALEKT